MDDQDRERHTRKEKKVELPYVVRTRRYSRLLEGHIYPDRIMAELSDRGKYIDLLEDLRCNFGTNLADPPSRIVPQSLHNPPIPLAISDPRMSYVSASEYFFKLDVEPESCCLCRAVLYVLPWHHIVISLYIYTLFVSLTCCIGRT